MKNFISILGSTGSVGRTTLSIIESKNNKFIPFLFSASKNYKKIYNQIKKYKPIYFVIDNYSTFKKIKKNIKKCDTKILNNYNGIKIDKKLNTTISAIPGLSGLEPTIRLTEMSKKILIANKESVICGWNLIKKSADKNGTKIIPIDSEHFSIMQLLKGRKLEEINKIYLTASGGPFLKYKPRNLLKIKPKEAIKHPKWKMGKKISIDSSTMMNKILEIIEAQKLFGLPNTMIDIIIHPQSLVHAIIDFKNGLKEFLYHDTSMVIPIANALYDENINISNFYKNNKKMKISNLNFHEVDKKIFPIVKIKNRVNEYPSTSIIINASNEILVDQFIKKKVPFLAISEIIMGILNDRNYKKYAIQKPKNISHISKIDSWARLKTLETIQKKYE
jgi:1-deoxy-D-xylulose-5-phosphate reductoisomerase